MTASVPQAADVLRMAGTVAGVNVQGAALIRDGSHVMYQLPGSVVARIGKAGSKATAELEIRAARWLAASGLSVIQALPDVLQPTMVGERPVTWWVQLPEHRPASPGELGAVLRELHYLPIPDSLDLPRFDPFAELADRIAGQPDVSEDDRTWLAGHLAELQERYSQLALGESCHVIHGDAWQGNIAVPEVGQPVLLDLEKVSVGDVEWDLVPAAVDRTDFARLTTEEYQSFVTAYGGYDVTSSPAYRVFADIQELRWVCFVLSKAGISPPAAAETRHRIACIRGEVARPWSWRAF